MLNQELLKNALSGMYWNIGRYNFEIPFIKDTKKAISIFRTNLANITWNCMSALEANPTTLPQTQTILKGQSVGGISIHDLMQVKNYGDAARELINLLEQNSFSLSLNAACALHKYTGKEEALAWGEIRTSGVMIAGNTYVPPTSDRLEQIAATGFAFLDNMISDPKERAVAVFLFMSRNQFFFDANKRTASLIMNGCLMQNGFWPITILNRDSEEFHQKLCEFYETGNADPMMEFFSRQIRTMYPEM